MQDSNLLVYVASEIALLLLAVCIFLCFHVKSLKKLISKLEEKVNNLRDTVITARKETKAVQKKLAKKEKIKPKEFIDYLDDEIEQTLGHHKSLKPDRDIVLDITPDAPIERQAASLRHAFLIAEKEARYAGEASTSSWDVLQAKLQQIIQFYESAAPAEEAPEEIEPEPDVEPAPEPENDRSTASEQEIENYKKQIENLNRYKKLFFDTEDKWQKAKAQADEYHRQLLEKSKAFDDGGDFESLLESYAHAYDDVEAMIVEGSGGENLPEGAEFDERAFDESSGVGKSVIANQEEMQRLRNMAVDQHKVITQLKSKLVDAKTPEEHQEAMERVSEQLEQQQRFLKEAETCTQLIEDELSRTIQENEDLRVKLEQGDSSGVSEEEIGKLETLVEEMTNESKEMLRTIASLEQENQTLKESIDAGGGGETSEEATLLKEKLSEMQQELLNMQTQQIELEERYLELKMSSS